MFAAAYYGLLRISEVAEPHPVMARDVHYGVNKEKILFVLRSSKTHGKANKPQLVEINGKNSFSDKRFCPFQLVRRYAAVRPKCKSRREPFFVYSDRSPITPYATRSVLKSCITKAGINPVPFGFHSFRIGRSTDLFNQGYTVAQIQKLGHWKSNAVFKYLR